MANKKADMKKIWHYSRGDVSTYTLVILGIIVGLLNITAKETTEFLVASLVLLVSLGMTALTLASIHITLGTIWNNAITFIAPAAIIVALKAVFSVANIT